MKNVRYKHGSVYEFTKNIFEDHVNGVKKNEFVDYFFDMVLSTEKKLAHLCFYGKNHRIRKKAAEEIYRLSLVLFSRSIYNAVLKIIAEKNKSEEYKDEC